MLFVPEIERKKGWWKGRCGFLYLALTALLALPGTVAALPARLVLALDGIAYRDLQALQTGFTRTNFLGHPRPLRAFTAEEGYFPVSRMISTFPSASDVAWTDIFGDRPLPGYQRTYFSTAANSEIAINGVTTTMEHEHQMHFQEQDGFLRAMGYLFPLQIYDDELRGSVRNFWNFTADGGNYYAYSRASDDCQHLDRDVFALLLDLDHRLQKLRAQYKLRTGRELEIVILSDHGHNHAGRGKRVAVRRYLESAGYHIGASIRGPQDVVLPTVGIENWVEIHNAPAATETLARRLCGLAGVDLIAAANPRDVHQFWVLNPKNEQAAIDWQRDPVSGVDSFRYVVQRGDPLHYQPVLDTLARRHKLDSGGFATAAEWMAATMTNHYPLAPERIVRGLSQNTLNPATIILSLDNRFVNDEWLTQQGSRLVTCRSTHGGLDDICSDGMLLSNFKPTHDTSTARVADQFGGFTGVKNFRAGEDGAEFITREQTRPRLFHDPLDQGLDRLPAGATCLRVWSPKLIPLEANAAIEVAIQKTPAYSTASIRRLTLDSPVAFPESAPYERVYALPAELKLEPDADYSISGRLASGPGGGQLFSFSFRTTADGAPAPY